MHVKARLFLWKLATFIWLFSVSQAVPAENPPSGQKVEAFFNAIQEDDTHTGLAMLAADTNLETRNELGLTPLQVAVHRGHLAGAALLVDKGADVNARDPAGNPLLHQLLLQARAGQTGGESQRYE